MYFSSVCGLGISVYFLWEKNSIQIRILSDVPFIRTSVIDDPFCQMNRVTQSLLSNSWLTKISPL